MRNVWRSMVGAVAIAVSVTLVAPAPAPAVADTAAHEAAFVSKLNDLRASKGLRTLKVDTRLTGLGRAWADKLADDGRLSHNMNLPKVAPSTWLVLGENVGTGDDVQSIHNAFVASPGHYKNLLDRRWDSVGIGVVVSGGRIWVAEQFMATKKVKAKPKAKARKAKKPKR